MRALVQRVSSASVTVDGRIVGEIGRGLLVFVAVTHSDTYAHADKLARKLMHLRVFPDEQGKMNLDVSEVAGELLIVSQFTLYGDTSRGNRPSFIEAARPELAERLYEQFVKVCQSSVPVATGVFQSHMEVALVNDGPVTLMCYAEG